MPYELQLKPLEPKNGQKYKVITITDVTFHANNLRPTQSVGKKLVEALKNQEPGRIYSKIEKQGDSNSYELAVTLLKKDPDFIKMLQEEEKKGYKVLLKYPKAGIPMLVGKDAVDFIHSTQGKRVLRWLDKKKVLE